MAVVHRHRQDRESASGNDILSRMLQLEKLSQQHRPSGSEQSTSSFRNSSLESQRREIVPKQPSKLTTPPVMIPPPSVPLQRAHTSPGLVMKPATNHKKSSLPASVKQIEVAAVQRPPTPTPEICKSPSWSDYNGDKAKRQKKKTEKDRKEMEKERKELEKERKEVEKKRKKEDEKQRSAQVKAAKRLSKKPPAAMDTQRMPAALLRPSARPPPDSQASSQADSRSSSTERRRSSISSLASMLRLSKDSWSKSSTAASEPPSSFKLVSFKPVSASAPQLGKLSGIETHSRPPSVGTQDSRNSNSDQEYLKDLASFAYQLQVSAQAPDDIGLELKQINGVRLSVPSTQSSPDHVGSVTASPTKRKDEDTVRETKKKEKKAKASQRPLARRSGSSEDGYFGEKVNVLKDYPNAKLDGAKYDEAAKKWAIKEAGSRELREVYQNLSRQSSPALISDTKTLLLSPRDGSSYVHKQRMYRQQQSIAGYEDELALESAGNAKMEEKTPATITQPSPPILKDSFELTPTKQVSQLQTREEKTSTPVQAPASTTLRSSPKTAFPNHVPRSQEATVPREPVRKKQNLEQTSSEESSDEYHRYLVEHTRNLGIKQAKRVSRIPKAEKILGARDSDTENAPPSKRRSGPNRAVSSDSTFIPSPNETVRTPRQRIDSDLAQAIQKNTRKDKPLSPKVDGQKAVADMPAAKQPLSENTTSKSKHYSSPVVPRFSTTPVLPNAGRQSSELSPETSRGLLSEKSHRVAESDTASKSPITEIGKIPPEFIISGVDGDGLVRKTSLKRPRSDPELKLNVLSNPSTNHPTVPSFDFLPALKHQPLTKPKRTSPVRVSFAALPTTIPSSTHPASTFPQSFRPALKADYSFPSPNGPITITPVAAHNSVHPAMRTFHGPPRSHRSSLMGPPSLPLTSSGRAAEEALNVKPLAKMFVICCKCKFWHDMPSKLYEAMALPKQIEGQANGVMEGVADVGKAKGKGKAVEGKVFTTVTCPWCEHGMSTACCAGWTAVVYLHERHH
ncbi:hypothetical protein MMC18_001418 [Xylographa bjoerkii]|nr:hypothetical protein [Xylographa bjoerkii]